MIALDTPPVVSPLSADRLAADAACAAHGHRLLTDAARRLARWAPDAETLAEIDRLIAAAPGAEDHRLRRMVLALGTIELRARIDGVAA